jgi:hypothetical protein
MAKAERVRGVDLRVGDAVMFQGSLTEWTMGERGLLPSSPPRYSVQQRKGAVASLQDRED